MGKVIQFPKKKAATPAVGDLQCHSCGRYVVLEPFTWVLTDERGEAFLLTRGEKERASFIKMTFKCQRCDSDVHVFGEVKR